MGWIIGIKDHPYVKDMLYTFDGLGALEEFISCNDIQTNTIASLHEVDSKGVSMREFECTDIIPVRSVRLLLVRKEE